MLAELIALADSSKEVEWLRNLTMDVPLCKKPIPAITINCDNQGTMYKISSKSYNGKSRHISLRHQYMRQLLKSGVIVVDYVESTMNLVDPLMKGLPREMI